MRRAALGCFLVALSAAPWRASQAQTATELLAQGVAAYQDFNFEAAARLLGRALAPDLESSLPRTDRLRGTMYLAASELFGNHRSEATDWLQAVLSLDPRYQPDSLLFPPEVLRVFDAVRRSTKIVTVALPAELSLLVGRDTLAAQVYASSLHDISARVERDNGRLVRALYQGPIGDSLTVLWDGRDAAGAPVGSGRYRLTVISQSPDGHALRSAAIPLAIVVSRPDSAAVPRPPASAPLLPERTPAAPGLAALTAGLLGGGLAAILPSLVGASADGSGRRFVVASAVSLAGIVGLVHHGLGRPIPANAAANVERRAAWRQQVALTQAARGNVVLHITPQPLVRAEGTPP